MSSPVYTSEDLQYRIGGIYTIKEGQDVVIFANGVMVSKAMEAAGSTSKGRNFSRSGEWNVSKNFRMLIPWLRRQKGSKQRW